MAKLFSETMVCRRIARLRRSSKLSIEDFAELLGVSKTSLANYERDKQTPGCHFFIKVCAVFGGTVVGWVLGDGDDADIERMNVPHIVKNFDKLETIRELRAKTFSDRYT